MDMEGNKCGYMKAFSQHLHVGIEENHEISVRIADLRADIQIRDLSNTRQRRQPLNRDFRSESVATRIRLQLNKWQNFKFEVGQDNEIKFLPQLSCLFRRVGYN
jgi:hypothetical protein